jgi:hypothetical protein
VDVNHKASHVTFESWCERAHLIAFDFDPSIVGIAAQPFASEFTTTNDSRQTHVPDYFLRTASGGAMVVDVKPDELITAKDWLNFTGTAALRHQVGWGYRRLGELPQVLGANLRWLAGYRHERVRDNAIASHACQAVQRSPCISLRALSMRLDSRRWCFPRFFTCSGANSCSLNCRSAGCH